MKTNITGMEANMEQLLKKIVSVQSKSDGVNTSLFAKREHIEKLHRTRNFLRKIQFIYDLPARLRKCIESEAYADAVRFFIGAKPIFEAYGNSSFQDCKRSSEEAMVQVIENLKGKLYSDSEPIEARAEAVVILKRLNFPVDTILQHWKSSISWIAANFLFQRSWYLGLFTNCFPLNSDLLGLLTYITLNLGSLLCATILAYWIEMRLMPYSGCKSSPTVEDGTKYDVLCATPNAAYSDASHISPS